MARGSNKKGSRTYFKRSISSSLKSGDIVSFNKSINTKKKEYIEANKPKTKPSQRKTKKKQYIRIKGGYVQSDKHIKWPISKIKQVTVDDIRNMKYDDLNELVKRAGKLANSRMNRLINNGKSSPMTEKFIEKGGIKEGGSLNELRAKASEAINILNSQTSTVKGYDLWESRVGKAMGNKDYVNWDAEKKQEFWKLHNRLLSENKAELYNIGYSSDQFIKNLNEYFVQNENESFSNKYKEFEGTIRKEYEDKMMLDKYADIDSLGGNRNE